MQEKNTEELEDCGVSLGVIEWIESLNPQEEIGWNEQFDAWAIDTQMKSKSVINSVPTNWVEEGGFHALISCPDGQVFVFIEDWLSGCIHKNMEYGDDETTEYCRAKGEDMRERWEKALGSGWAIKRKGNDPEERVVRYAWVKMGKPLT